MKSISLTLLLGLLLVTGKASAQTICQPSDPALTPVDTVTVSVSVTPPQPPDTGTYNSGKKKGNTGHIIWEMVLWNTSGGPAIGIDPASIVFSGDSEAIDGMSVNDILDLIAQTSIAQAMASGSLSCPTNCQSTIAVLFPACVSRSGAGSSTRIVACQGASCCTRLYQVCCPVEGGPPIITPLSSQGGGCESAFSSNGSPCVPTCN